MCRPRSSLVGHAEVGKPSLEDLIGSVELFQNVAGDGIAAVQLWPKASEVLDLDRLILPLPVRELELDYHVLSDVPGTHRNWLLRPALLALLQKLGRLMRNRALKGLENQALKSSVEAHESQR